MEDLLKELLEHYNEMIIALVEKVQDAEDREMRYCTEKADLRRKNDEQAKKLEELSRTITILRKTLKCHNDFIDNGDLREDYEKFQDKWIDTQEVEE